jgi:EAL domain-containing protein (putative c-di-GMP-specific phosphodiesterase class I)/CheY-like chemotaxis protein
VLLRDVSVLAVEDHAFQRSVLLAMLNALGAKHVSMAVDGASALEHLARSTVEPDIIISDLDMPGMDGMEFVRHLGASKRRVPVILASAVETSLLASVETMTRAYGVNIIGVIEKPITPAKLADVLKRHAANMASRKRTGPGVHMFSLDEIEAGLGNDEFEPYFQPKVDLQTGALRGAEALARWRHPMDGIVPPLAFIERLEASELIDELTWIILRKSAAFCQNLRDASGLDLSVSVNLSVKSLADVHLADRVTEVVRRQGLDPRHMILEVTESATTTEVGHVLENLSRLRMKGFGLSIDDYGTGYSSMQQLTRIAFTELKVDQSFVANAPRHAAARVVLESSLDMARKLNIASVAEGIESQDDWDLLRGLGCEVGQGYFIARPMEAGAFKRWTMARGAVASAGA